LADLGSHCVVADFLQLLGLRFLPVMVGSILLNWWAAGIYAITKRHAIITAAIIADLAILGIFKYTNFFAENLAAILDVLPPRFQIALPLGISFFTFHHIMYLVDLGRGKAPTYSLDKYALYICFFPQALAGPIARWNEVIWQFGDRAFAPGWQRRCVLGVIFIVIGLVQKVFLGDPLESAVNAVYENARTDPLLDGSA
jgi:D-alanyl-lipoteichoic acid acyltransferase DltB (MBOAT superfamily)